jgi:TrmH family RNA methyltransferase
LNERGWELVNRMGAKGIRVEQVNAGLLNSLSATESSQGILAVLEYSELPLPPKLDFVLVLDQLRDPGNLGTLLRSAAAAGVQAVCLSPESAEPFAPKVVRSGMGAHFRLPIRTESWEAIGEHLTGLKICLADLQGVSCWQADLSIPLALIIGGEAAGVGPEARTLADTRVSIPMPGGSESLNAASAGAVLMFEALRQRQVRHPAGRMA